jgi:hypothetical protein
MFLQSGLVGEALLANTAAAHRDEINIDDKMLCSIWTSIYYSIIWAYILTLAGQYGN